MNPSDPFATQPTDKTATGPSGVPQRFGPYRILRVLGKGGMGAVFLAHDPKLDRQVALKVPLFQPDEEAKMKRFYREARAAATLNHPNICPVYEVGEDNGRPYLAMAFIEGHTLSKPLRNDAKNRRKRQR